MHVHKIELVIYEKNKHPTCDALPPDLVLKRLRVGARIKKLDGKQREN